MVIFKHVMQNTYNFPSTTLRKVAVTSVIIWKACPCERKIQRKKSFRSLRDQLELDATSHHYFSTVLILHVVTQWHTISPLKRTRIRWIRHTGAAQDIQIILPCVTQRDWMTNVIFWYMLTCQKLYYCSWISYILQAELSNSDHSARTRIIESVMSSWIRKGPPHVPCAFTIRVLRLYMA